MSPDQYEVNGTPEHWSAKDLLAHIAAWKRQGIEWLAAAERDDPSPHFKDMEQFNEETFTTSQGLSWQEIQNEAEQAFTELVTHVEQLPEKKFVEPEGIIWQIMACGSKHPYRHLVEYFLQQGDLDQATHLCEELIEIMRRMPLPPQELGRAIYQQASFYAMTSQHTRAIEKLGLALQLEPRVIAWVERDNTWDSLRTLPSFQALHSI